MVPGRPLAVQWPGSGDIAVLLIRYIPRDSANPQAADSVQSPDD
jgi:hypothetical protein